MLWDEAQASALGTAPFAQFWLALEQDGPWGRQAATQSHLDPQIGGELDRMCQDAGGRFILIRRPGTHPDHHANRPQRVYLAGGLARTPWLLEADLEDPARLTRLARLKLEAPHLVAPRSERPPLEPQHVEAPRLERAPLEPQHFGAQRLERAPLEPQPIGAQRLGRPRLALQHLATSGQEGVDAMRAILPEFRSSLAPVLMICANSKRDVCCAVRGRPVALESAAQRPGQVWECSHTGGHRFAPTGVLLPYGQTFGRLSGTSAVAALDGASRGEVPMELLDPAYDRGRSSLIAPAQAAESFVRQEIREPSLLALSAMAAPAPDRDGAWQCRVSHVDGRHWDVLAVRGPGGNDLPDSCGKATVPRWTWDCRVG